MPFLAFERPKTWWDQIIRRMDPLLDAAEGAFRVKGRFLEELEQPTADQFTPTVTGSGSVNDETGTGGSRGGAIVLATGATAASTAIIRGKTGKRHLGGGSSEMWAIAFRSRIETGPVDAQLTIRYGLVDGADAQQATIGVTGSASTTQWQLRNSGGAATALGGTIDIANQNTFVILNDGTNLRAFFAQQAADIVEIASVASNVASASLKWEIFIGNGTTAANKTIRLEKLGAIWLDRDT